MWTQDSLFLWYTNCDLPIQSECWTLFSVSSCVAPPPGTSRRRNLVRRMIAALYRSSLECVISDSMLLPLSANCQDLPRCSIFRKKKSRLGFLPPPRPLIHALTSITQGFSLPTACRFPSHLHSKNKLRTYILYQHKTTLPQLSIRGGA